ncbi:ThuA domain-containing protein [Microbacterium sp. A93]|uniref:ThuA domain-containing protein n=1 Tax=Microbacterium sp. A93 TaxID=3450716 RepID=UPI003F4394B2
MTDVQSTALIVVASGVGKHADPWHALEATSAAIAAIVADMGHVRVVTTDEVDAWAGARVLILNVSGDLGMPPGSSALQMDAIVAHHNAGLPILAVHSSSLAFRDDPRWREILGGRWIPGVTMHPQIGNSLIQHTPADRLPEGVVAFEEDFFVYDERYTNLELDVAPHVLAIHTEDGHTHPIAWWKSAQDGHGAVVYDALGHGVESYDSRHHRAWLRDAVRVLLNDGHRSGPL